MYCCSTKQSSSSSHWNVICSHQDAYLALKYNHVLTQAAILLNFQDYRQYTVISTKQHLTNRNQSIIIVTVPGVSGEVEGATGGCVIYIT